MNRNNDYRTQWQRDRQGAGQRPEGEPAPAFETLRGPLQQAGLWAAGCLLLASTVPAVLVAPLLRELLLISGFIVSMSGLLRGETLTLQAFNRQDVALLLVALGLIAALFVDPAAVKAFIEANGLGAARDSAAGRR